MRFVSFKSALGIVLSMFISSLSFAQLVTVNDIHFHVNTGAIVQVNGDVAVIDSCLYNRGNVTIDGSLTNNGIVYGADNMGNGSMQVSQSWTNNASFRSGLGIVTLNGTNQTIGGTKSTDYYNLTTSNAGIKTLANDIKIKNHLNLTNSELATESFIARVTNPDVFAISRTTGFVSSTTGWLYRTTMLPEEYIFPTGSSVDTLRYRPVYLLPRPTISGIDTFAVRFVNHDPALDGYDRMLRDPEFCYINPLWYHDIDRVAGADLSDIRIEFDTVADKYAFNQVGHWDTNPTNLWNNTGNDLYFPADAPSTLASAKAFGWNDYSPHPFVLAFGVPAIGGLNGDDELCFGEETKMYYVTAGIDSIDYDWTVTGGTILGDVTNDTIYVTWDNPGVGTVSVSQSILGLCSTNTLNSNVIIHPKPIAAIAMDTNNVFEHDLVHFMDSTDIAGTKWYWDFGDNLDSDQQNPYHKYENPGEYTITMIVSTQFNCKDTTETTFSVVKGVIAGNVFTPNDDGYNDVFRVKTSGVQDTKLQVFNRWGNIIFESYAQHAGWNGRTSSGEEAPAGTYYYIFQGMKGDQPVKESGYVSLVRAKMGKAN